MWNTLTQINNKDYTVISCNAKDTAVRQCMVCNECAGLVMSVLGL